MIQRLEVLLGLPEGYGDWLCPSLSGPVVCEASSEPASLAAGDCRLDHYIQAGSQGGLISASPFQASYARPTAACCL